MSGNELHKILITKKYSANEYFTKVLILSQPI